MSAEKLFTPLKVGAVTAPNRVFMAPLTRLRSIEPGDIPTPLMGEYYRQRASSGLIITEAYYWDKDDLSREFGKKFFARMNRMPTMNQASTYSATLHYLKAVKAANTRDTKTVMAKMREMPVKDYFTQNGVLREDGRMVHSMLLLQVKKPEESKYPWDYYKVLAEVPGDQVFRPIKDGGCPLMAGK